jgi:hypothetical protein
MFNKTHAKRYVWNASQFKCFPLSLRGYNYTAWRYTYNLDVSSEDSASLVDVRQPALFFVVKILEFYDVLMKNLHTNKDRDLFVIFLREQ